MWCVALRSIEVAFFETNRQASLFILFLQRAIELLARTTKPRIRSAFMITVPQKTVALWHRCLLCAASDYFLLRFWATHEQPAQSTARAPPLEPDVVLRRTVGDREWCARCAAVN
jgi:hypothetical protein